MYIVCLRVIPCTCLLYWHVKLPFVEALNLKKTEACTFTCCGWKINKLEVTAFVSIFSLPLLFDWIPFVNVTNTYGSPRGPDCWMYSLKSDCSINEAGLWEQIWLWNVPYGFVALLTILLFVASFCLLGRGLRNAKFQKLVEVGFFDSLISLAVLSVAFILETVCGYYFTFQDHNYAVWASYWLYLSDPLNSTFIPITLLFAIHLPLSSVIVRICCKYQRQNLIHTQRTFDQATFRSSTWIQQPSHTTWDPPSTVPTRILKLCLLPDTSSNRSMETWINLWLILIFGFYNSGLTFHVFMFLSHITVEATILH